ncbi:carbohydrate ABC transporter permease [Flavimaricola marinus]|uniref:sn-glycerol-3-phosphate transport system permease protein UgpE n=1 Tax=Flavimaricola marinus TaxID=1819565 RepID=A0A238LCG6_9RHOB|nr:carbohydrate ABC transporter permease [Flavimaricola marinus]SMY07318.1 L-arabinose transport system permease protein AraQ [Flavimaricola marinus]
MFPRPIEKASPAWQYTYQGLLPLALIMWLLPLLAVAMFSMKPDADFTSGNYWTLPSYFAGFENYSTVFGTWQRTLDGCADNAWPLAFNNDAFCIFRFGWDYDGSDMVRYMFNSIMITIPTVIGVVALSSMTGFALGIYKFRSNLLIFFMFVAGNFVPFQILMVPVRDLTLDMGLYNTKTGLVLFHIAFQTGFATLFMRNFIRALPFELVEAARVEGIAEWRIYWFVVLPLLKPALAAMAVLIFTFIWNDFFWAVVLTQGAESQPVTAGITSFNAQYRAAYHLMSAGSIVAALPPVMMFFLMQKHFIAGLTLGAVK